MESKKLTIALVLVLSMGGVYYGYSEYYSSTGELSQIDDLADVEDPNTSQAQAETDEGATLDQNTSEEGDTITTDREIKGRNNTQTDTERQGITITTDNIVAGEPVRVTVYTEEGERLEEEPVYVNGNQVGETRHTGALVFEAPNTNQITVETDTDLEPATRTVRQNDKETSETAETPEFSLEYPDRETVETLNNETSINFEFTVGDRANAEQATITLENDEGEEIDSHTRSIDSHTTYNYEFEDIPSSEDGETYTWTISAEDGEVSESTSFEIIKNTPEFTANLLEPEEGDEIDDYEVEFELEVEGETDAELEVEVIAAEDGQEYEEGDDWEEGDLVTVYEEELREETDEIIQFERIMPEEDLTYEWEAEIIFNGENIEQSDTKQFKTLQPPPYGDPVD